MSPVHIHLILNHVPIIGAILGFVLFAAAVVRTNQEMMRVAMALFVFLGLVAIPVFLTGEPSEDVVEHLPGVSKAVLEKHEESADISLIAIEILAVASLAGLIMFRNAFIPRWLTTTMLILALIASGLMSVTGNLGGQIRHSEIRSDTAADVPAVNESGRSSDSDDD